MPKIERARAAGPSRKGRRAPARQTAEPANRIRLKNWFAARLRGLRYRAGHGLRLLAMAAVGLVVLTAFALSATGRLDELGSALHAGLDARLARSGLDIRSIDVTGAERVTAEDIAAAIAPDARASLLAVDPGEARAAIEALGWVEAASVVRLWPDRISVVLKERQPAALWQSEGAHHVISRDGTVIEGADPASFTALPRLVGAGANVQGAQILDLLARQPEIEALTTHAVRVGERRWNLRLVAGGDILLPEADPASALALIASLHRERSVLNLDAQAFDLRSEGELVIRAWPDRAEAARGRGA